MTLKYGIKTAINGLKTNKSRSLLTILGIVIGVMAIIIMMSLGEGAKQLIVGQIQSIGPKTITISPGRRAKGPANILSTFSDSLKEKDLEALKKKENVPHLSEAMPIVFGSATAVYENETYQPGILGLTEFFSKMFNLYPSQGRVFTEDEVKSYANVAIIGSKVKKELFGNEEAVGQKIKIKNRNFRVIGVFPEKGQVSSLSFDNAIIIPYTTAQRYIFGIKYFNSIIVEADDEKNVNQTAEDIINTLRTSHNITDPDKDDFSVQTQVQAMEMINAILNVQTAFLTAIAAISLIVGGIGIMNIMMVSVSERTHEIGLRKAIGATDKDILNQFLLEAVLLTVIGGIIGIALGAFFSFIGALILTKFTALQWTFTFPVFAAILGIAVSAATGLIFGIYPARNAALKNPIEALRYE